LKPTAIAIYDARTHWKLDDGAWSYEADGDTIAIVARVSLLRPAPVELMVDWSWGEPETIVQPAVDGARFVFKGSALELLGVIPADRGFSVTSPGPAGGVMQFRNLRTTRPAAMSVAVFARDTTASVVMDTSAIDPLGKSFAPAEMSERGRYRWYRFETSAVDLAQIRIEAVPNVTREIVRLPELYGVPEINRGAGNLLDVQLAYVPGFGTDYLKKVLEETLQLRIVMLSGPAGGASAGPAPVPASAGASARPATGFMYWNQLPPREYRDIRASELLKELETALPPHQIRIDEAAGELQIIPIEPSWFEKGANRLGIRLPSR
jgi:hypothetical protein